jgi:hypothetical protein
VLFQASVISSHYYIEFLFRNDGVNPVVLKSVDGLLEDGLFSISCIGHETTESDVETGVNASGRRHFNVQINPRSTIEFTVTVNAR